MGSCHPVAAHAAAGPPVVSVAGRDNADVSLQQQQRQQQTTGEGTQDLQVRKEHDEDSELAAYRSSKLQSKEEVRIALQPCQRAAIEYVERVARPAHDKVLPQLEKRVKALGYDREQLYRCLAYIQDDAPIIIHLTETTLGLLNKDDHYRSLFETNTSAGTASTTTRKNWEHALFGNSYRGVEGHQRPKYGCLNVAGDIAGVKPARRYGKLYLVLARHIRHRATFSADDTGNKPLYAKHLATNECYANVLSQYSDSDLKAALNVPRVGGSASTCETYKEVQIHGPVCLATDIEALSVPGHENSASKKLKTAVDAFQKKTNCNVLWQGDLLSSELALSKVTRPGKRKN